MSSQLFPLPLFHGTSSLFLADIASHGLGAKNPLTDLQLFDFVQELNPLVNEYLSNTDLFKTHSAYWPNMVSQANSGMNFQHGETYVTPVLISAIRYAATNRYGSELLTYALEFLQKLLELDLPAVRRDLYGRYPEIFHLLDLSPAPLLVRANEVQRADLVNEKGGPPDQTLAFIDETLRERPEMARVLFQQFNFRLRHPIRPAAQKIWLVCIKQWNIAAPDFDLYELNPRPKQSEQSWR